MEKDGEGIANVVCKSTAKFNPFLFGPNCGFEIRRVVWFMLTQQNPPKFQSALERSGAKERAETLPPIRGRQEPTMCSQEHVGALRSASHLLRSTCLIG